MKKGLIVLLLFMATGFVFASGVEEQKTSKIVDPTDFSEPLTIQVNVRDTQKQNNDARYRFIEDKFNVKFELVNCSLNTIREQSRVWVGAGDMPEIMWMDFKARDTNEVKSWEKDGMFKAFPDLNENYPNLAKLNETVTAKDSLLIDDTQYIYLPSRGMSEFDDISDIRFYYRADWAKKLNMYQESYTWDEMGTLIKAFKEKDPGNIGAGKTIGIVAANWAFPSLAGILQCNPYWKVFHKLDGEYVFGPAEESTIKGIKIAKQMYDDGLVWSDQPLTKDAQYRFNSGQAGVLYTNVHTAAAGKLLNDLKKVDSSINIDEAVEPMQVSGPNGDYYVEKTEQYYGAWGFRYDIDDAKMYRFLAIMDWLATDDGLNFQLYGIKGQDYEDKANGSVNLLWPKENDKYVSPYVAYSDRLFAFCRLTNGVIYRSPAVIKQARAIREKEIELNEAVADKLIWADYDYDFISFSAPNKDKYGSLGSEASDKIVELIIGSDNIEKEYRTWLKTIMPKAQLVLDEVNNSYLVK